MKKDLFEWNLLGEREENKSVKQKNITNLYKAFRHCKNRYTCTD